MIIFGVWSGCILRVPAAWFLSLICHVLAEAALIASSARLDAVGYHRTSGAADLSAFGRFSGVTNPERACRGCKPVGTIAVVSFGLC